MRIAYLCGAPIPSKQAASVHVMRMCQAFAANGHEVRCYARSGTLEREPFAHYGVARTFELVRLHRPAVRMLGAATYSMRLYRALRAGARPDIIYSRYPHALLAASRMGVPMILEMHVVSDRAADRMAQQYLLRHPLLARVVLISDSLRRDYLAAFPFLDPARVVVAHDGADALEYAPPAPSTGPMRAGYAGSFYKGRGIDFVLGLAERLPQVEIHLAGGEAADLERLGLAGRVAALPNIRLHGVLAPADVARFLSSMDVLLAPYGDTVTVSDKGDISRWISPLKIFEYMATGRPIVSTSLATIAEVLEDGKSALLCPPGDTDAWVEAIGRLERDPGLRVEIGNAARRVLETEYTWRTRAQRVLEGLSPVRSEERIRAG